jgi:hypothetical protein
MNSNSVDHCNLIAEVVYIQCSYQHSSNPIEVYLTIWTGEEKM